MALLPRLYDDDFGIGVWPTDLYSFPSPRYLRPWLKNTFKDVEDMEKKRHIGKDGFEVCLDVQHFAPNEISVKTVDKSIIVEGKHEEKKDDHGYVSRQFTRRYELPEGFKTEDVVSTLSSDGVLTLKAPPAQAIEDKTRQVQIQHTGPARLNVSENKQEKLENCEKK